ncbi:MAG: hypothetical protein HN353_06710 [Bdellovibrionales bacterium]|nr:hypothetical protein [Bdellovibrionales bacterium]MBT3525221.1 hypothetical protein [Bdellovibrionales bacterium]MBT7668253.1 hypothetical protein [Bdellovibrionales bacterium]
MELKNKILKLISAPTLRKNDELKGIHDGENCYIIGNGSSLRNIQLDYFSDRPAICINHFSLHKDAALIDYRYHVLVEPFFCYPYVRNPYINKLQYNVFWEVFKASFSEYPDVIFFTSISNKFGNVFPNTRYLHHFGHRKVDKGICDISGNFSFLAGGFAAAIGLAINLGFKRATLLGCDYLLTPIRTGHFYAYGDGMVTNDMTNVYANILDEIDGLIELSIITDEGSSKWVQSQTFKELSGHNIIKRRNIDVIRPEYLDILAKLKSHKGFCDKVYNQ